MMRWKSGDEIDSPEKLHTLPPGTVIIDNDLRAVRTRRGAFLYLHDGQHWEPLMFPCIVESVPSMVRI